MQTTKVLIADDSTVFRRALAKVLGDEAGITLVGEAQNGEQTIELLNRTKPDICILDIEMPGKNGLEVLQATQGSKTKFIIFSAQNANSAKVTLEALSLGASDFMSKPGNSLTEALTVIKSELVPKILALSKPTTVNLARIQTSLKKTYPTSVRAILIGVSTGGPEALAKMMPLFNTPLPIPIFIVQHMPPIFTKKLAERLSELCSFPVHEAQQGMVATNGEAYLAPGGVHMELRDEKPNIKIALTEGPPILGCKPSVDVLFSSAADFKSGAFIAAILTGMGADGTKGSAALKKKGNYIMAQSEQICLIYGMPKSIVENNLADEIEDLQNIPARIHRILSEGTK